MGARQVEFPSPFDGRGYEALATKFAKRPTKAAQPTPVKGRATMASVSLPPRQQRGHAACAVDVAAVGEAGVAVVGMIDGAQEMSSKGEAIVASSRNEKAMDAASPRRGTRSIAQVAGLPIGG